jgi:hypothetical protein
MTTTSGEGMGPAGRNARRLALIAAMLAAGCVGEAPHGSPGPTPFEALGPRAHDVLSRRGAHTYVRFATYPEAPNALFVREYSDLMSHFGQYKPILSPLAEIERGLSCTAGNPTWSGVEVAQYFGCQEGEVRTRTLYAAPDTIAIRFDPSPDLACGCLMLAGCVARPDDGFLASDLRVQGDAIVAAAHATLVSFWGVSLPETWTATLRFDPPASSLETWDDGCWRATLPIDAPVVLTVGLHAETGEDATAPEPAETVALDADGFEAARAALRDELAAWFAEAPLPDPIDPPSAMSWFVLWENAAAPWGTRWTREAIVPSKRHYFRGVWLWDAAFHATALAGGNANARALGMDQLRLLADNAADDGRIPREVWAHDAGTGTQPPGVMAWAALTLADRAGDDAIVAEMYAPLVANHAWFVEAKDADGDGRCEWSREDSGMDTSPRFDGGPVEGVDVQSWLALDAELLGRMAARLGRDDDATAWQVEAAARRDDLRDAFWDATDGFFYDRKVSDADDPFVRVRTPAAFLPLLVGAATADQAAAMASRLDEPAFLAAPFGLPSVSTAHEAYDPDNYWRGPTWIVTNAIAVWGLQRYGLDAPADALRRATLALIAGDVTPREYYDSQTGVGLGAPDFGWSAAFHLLLQGTGPSWLETNRD